MNERVIAAALANKKDAIFQLDRADAEEHLIDFIELLWPVLEPGREFLRGKVVEVICDHLEAVSDGRIRKLLINVPPGCMKSLTVNVFWPVWEWLRKPSLRYVSFAYAEHLTMRDNAKCLNLIRSDLFKQYWPDRLAINPESRAKGKFENMNTGFKLASSVSGVSTGERGDRVIVDDPHNVKEAESEAVRSMTTLWFTESLTTRINDSASAFVVIMQRVNELDVAGHIIEHLLDDGWDHLCLPMRYESDHPYKSKTALNFTDWRTEDGDLLWPERFDKKRQDSDERVMRSEGGDYAVAGQMQQRPAPRGGGMFKRDQFNFIDADELPPLSKVARGWDLASTAKKGSYAKAAYTAGVKIARGSDGNVYILDSVKKQAGPGDVEKLLRRTAEADGRGCTQDLPQDPGQAGVHQKKALATLLEGYDVRFGLESGAKEDRARPLAAQVEAGTVYLVRGPWNSSFLSECESFPAGRWKDQVDAATRGYSRVLKKRKPTLGAAPRAV